MYSLAWLVVVGVISAVLGGWLGHLVARVRSKSAERIAELEAKLESARGEMSGYRREVFDQFAETARKFRTLDESYHDLHRQLAASASLLCGEAAGPLLEAPPGQPALAREEPRSGRAEAATAPARSSVDQPAATKPAMKTGTAASAAGTAAQAATGNAGAGAATGNASAGATTGNARSGATTAEQSAAQEVKAERAAPTASGREQPDTGEQAAPPESEVPILVAEVGEAGSEPESEPESEPKSPSRPRRAEDAA